MSIIENPFGEEERPVETERERKKRISRERFASAFSDFAAFGLLEEYGHWIPRVVAVKNRSDRRNQSAHEEKKG